MIQQDTFGWLAPYNKIGHETTRIHSPFSRWKTVHASKYEGISLGAISQGQKMKFNELSQRNNISMIFASFFSHAFWLRVHIVCSDSGCAGCHFSGMLIYFKNLRRVSSEMFVQANKSQQQWPCSRIRRTIRTPAASPPIYHIFSAGQKQTGWQKLSVLQPKRENLSRQTLPRKACCY